MERHGHLKLDPRDTEPTAGRVSAATIDRLLSPEREATGRTRLGGAEVTSSAVEPSVPVRTFADWAIRRTSYFRMRYG